MGSPIEPTELRDFVRHTEGLVSPKDVGALYGRAEMLAKLPLAAQRWIVARADNSDYMGFVVEPYCTFLAYEITDLAAASRLLPPDYRLVPTTMFSGDTPRHLMILGAFTVHASVFWGVRVEQYLIAENTHTGMLTWVICDYESNTINYDPGQGFSAATTSRAVVTTTHAGQVVIDVCSKERPNALALTADLDSAVRRPLDQRLWIEGNLSVDYGGRLMHPGSDAFGLVFDPGEMTSALEIPLSAVTVDANTFGANFCADEPAQAACFPYAQHFLTTSSPQATAIRDEEDLERALREQVSAKGRPSHPGSR